MRVRPTPQPVSLLGGRLKAFVVDPFPAWLSQDSPLLTDAAPLFLSGVPTVPHASSRPAVFRRAKP